MCKASHTIVPRVVNDTVDLAIRPSIIDFDTQRECPSVPEESEAIDEQGRTEYYETDGTPTPNALEAFKNSITRMNAVI